MNKTNITANKTLFIKDNAQLLMDLSRWSGTISFDSRSKNLAKLKKLIQSGNGLTPISAIRVESTFVLDMYLMGLGLRIKRYTPTKVYLNKNIYNIEFLYIRQDLCA